MVMAAGRRVWERRMKAESGSRKGQGKLLVSLDPKDDNSARQAEILEAAAKLFSKAGYDGVGMRDIADVAGILPGSLYYHFKSKQEIYLAVHRAALARSAQRITAAIEKITAPWVRLEAAIAAQLEGQLDPGSITWPMINDKSAMSGEMRKALVADRDVFEIQYKQLIADLPLPARLDRSVLRLNLLATLNTVTVWYQPGKLTPRQIAAQIVGIIRPAG